MKSIRPHIVFSWPPGSVVGSEANIYNLSPFHRLFLFWPWKYTNHKKIHNFVLFKSKNLRNELYLRNLLRALVRGGNRSVVNGQWSVVSGQQSVVSGQRSVVSGQQSAVSGQRSAVSGQRSAVSGEWSAVSGQLSAFGVTSKSELIKLLFGPSRKYFSHSTINKIHEILIFFLSP